MKYVSLLQLPNKKCGVKIVWSSKCPGIFVHEGSRKSCELLFNTYLNIGYKRGVVE